MHCLQAVLQQQPKERAWTWKQKGLKVGDTYYDEIPKELIMLVVEDGDVDKVLKVIVENARVE